MNMICVMDVKVAIVPGNEWEVAHMKNRGYLRVVNGDGKIQRESVGVIREIVRGECFVNVRGEAVYIGASEKVQKTIGLPFGAFGNMRSAMEMNTLALEQCRSRSAMYQERIKNYNDLSFFKRLLFLIKGSGV